MTSDYLSDLSPDHRQRLAKVKLLGLDVDGTLSDGKLWYGSDGKEIKSFNVMDGFGMKTLREHGVEVALITTRDSPTVLARARDLGLRHVQQGTRDKHEALTHLCHGLNLKPDQVAFMGDDLLDLPALRIAGFAAAPANAHPFVRSYVHWVSRAGGGDGAVRELCDAILLSQGKLEPLIRRYLPA
jgi:3-deoxy-D-manno-octulosonate 8-phosphate phosphatase (KDO 8-P phosphatase)